jgi:hypothetical protein
MAAVESKHSARVITVRRVMRTLARHIDAGMLCRKQVAIHDAHARRIPAIAGSHGREPSTGGL